MTAVLILPGLFGSGEGHWQQHWLHDQPDSRCVVQDDWDNPQLDRWLSRLEEALDEVGEAYIVAHSLGCLLAAKLAGRYLARRVKGALLVAPCDLRATHSLHPGRIDFGDMPMQRLPFPNIVVGSLNDSYVSLDRLTMLGRCWNAEVKISVMPGTSTSPAALVAETAAIFCSRDSWRGHDIKSPRRLRRPWRNDPSHQHPLFPKSSNESTFSGLRVAGGKSVRGLLPSPSASSKQVRQ